MTTPTEAARIRAAILQRMPSDWMFPTELTRFIYGRRDIACVDASMLATRRYLMQLADAGKIERREVKRGEKIKAYQFRALQPETSKETV